MPSLKVLGANIHGGYGTATAVAGLFAFFGWALVVIGVLIVVGGFSAGAPFGFMIAGVGIGIAAIGLLQVAAEQMLRALTDNADYSRQSLILQIAMAEGRTEVDLRSPAMGQAQEAFADASEELATEAQTNATARVAADISKGLSTEALSALHRAADKGYQVRFSPDKSSVIISSGSWQTTFTSEAEIIKFGRDIR
jgi:hypothetical protein